MSDESVLHYGLIPRTNRGIFAINELPDLPPRIQVGLFNVLEERDVQIRGFAVRLNLDVCMVFSANPEDYTNRGRIVTPLKDRHGSVLRTPYPPNLQPAPQTPRPHPGTGPTTPHPTTSTVFVPSSRFSAALESITRSLSISRPGSPMGQDPVAITACLKMMREISLSSKPSDWEFSKRALPRTNRTPRRLARSESPPSS